MLVRRRYLYDVYDVDNTSPAASTCSSGWHFFLVLFSRFFLGLVFSFFGKTLPHKLPGDVSPTPALLVLGVPNDVLRIACICTWTLAEYRVYVHALVVGVARLAVCGSTMCKLRATKGLHRMRFRGVAAAGRPSPCRQDLFLDAGGVHIRRRCTLYNALVLRLKAARGPTRTTRPLRGGHLAS